MCPGPDQYKSTTILNSTVHWWLVMKWQFIGPLIPSTGLYKGGLSAACPQYLSRGWADNPSLLNTCTVQYGPLSIGRRVLKAIKHCHQFIGSGDRSGQHVVLGWVLNAIKYWPYPSPAEMGQHTVSGLGCPCPSSMETGQHVVWFKGD